MLLQKRFIKSKISLQLLKHFANHNLLCLHLNMDMRQFVIYGWLKVNYKQVSKMFHLTYFLVSPLQLAMSRYILTSKFVDSRLRSVCFLLSKELAVSVSLSVSLSDSHSDSPSLSVYQIKESLSCLAFCITMCINVVNTCLSLTIYPRPSVNNVYLWHI